jgi:hypothetical protein
MELDSRPDPGRKPEATRYRIGPHYLQHPISMNAGYLLAGCMIYWLRMLAILAAGMRSARPRPALLGVPQS